MFNVVGLMSSKLRSMPASESPTQTVVSSISKLLLKLYKTSAVFSSTFRKNAEVFGLISCPFWTMLQRSPASHLTAGFYRRH